MRISNTGLASHLFMLLLVGLAQPGCPGNHDVVGPAGVVATGGAGPALDGAQPDESSPLEEVKWTGKFDEGWKEYHRLVNQQKYQQASKLVEDMLQKAKSTKNSEEWVRGLIRYVQLRMALHGYETAVRFLKEQPWPEDLLGNTVMNLFYAQALVSYAQSYSFEIRQREKVESREVVDLKAWTIDQIYAEAQRAYQEVWKHRRQLGDHPIAHLSDYLEQNSYPAEIRPTLRDAVSYLRAELLADTTGWRPEHSNEIFQLDLEMLLGDVKVKGKPALGQLDLSDPAVHPLLGICAILDDLEKWHTQKGEKEAAFEARLTRLRHLHHNFTQVLDGARITKDLEDRLPVMRKLPWWSMGMATLAEFYIDQEAPDNRVRAHQIGKEGHQAHPNTIGGERCLNIVRTIEAPNYTLEAMASDGSQKPSIGVNHQNLSRLYFRAHPIDIQEYIRSSDDYNIFPNYQALEKLLKKTKPSDQWSIDLPATPDFKMHRTFATAPMKKPGFYVVTASAKDDFSKSDNLLRAAHLVIGDLVLVTRQEGGEAEVNVVSGSTGRPVPGTKVHLYRYDWRNRHRSVEFKTTDEKGSVRFKRSSNDSYFILAKKGPELAIDPNYLYLHQEPRPTQTTSTLLFTDRSIYRPLQKLYFKAVVYRGRYDQGRYQTAPSTTVTIWLMDPNYQVVEKKIATTNRHGTASGEFTIPAGRLLGQWQLKSSLNGFAVFRVEEYRRPTFETKLLDPESPLRLNQPATLKGEARYYFGLPVTSGTVKWRVTRIPVYPWWWGYYCWRDGMVAQTQTIDAGTSRLKEDGTFTIQFIPRADERLAEQSKDLSYSYSVNAEVTDEGGETRSAARSFRLGFVAVEASLVTKTNFFLEGRPGEVTIQRTNLDGIPAPGRGSFRIVALNSPGKTLLPADQPLPEPPTAAKKERQFLTPGDRQRPRWDPQYQPDVILRQWTDGVEKAHGKIVHHQKGEGKLGLPPLPSGAYRIHYQTTDPYGAKFKLSKEFIVAGPSTPLALPALLQIEKNSVKVGETARILALSGLSDQLIFLEFHRDGKLLERRFLESGKDQTLLEIPISGKDRGGFGVTLWVLRDHQFIYLQQPVFVPWDNQELKVEFATFRDKLRPGGKEKWTVKVTGPSGQDAAVAAGELLAYMYDRSLDAFVGHYPPSPLSLYPNRSYASWPRASLGRAREAWVESRGFTPPPRYPPLHGDYLKFYEGYGIGGVGARRYYARLANGWKQDPSSEATVTLGAHAVELSKPEQDKAENKLVVDGLLSGNGKDRREILGEVAQAPKPPPIQGTVAEQPVELRTDFSETAFWQPHLLTDADGTARVEFSVPDSVTSWNVWVHAVTRDLKGGSVKQEAQTVKELMVRPYLPRFLREGDRAELKVVVNNASDHELKGELTFDILEPETERSILETFGLKPEQARKRPFMVPAGGGTNLSFAVTAPAKVGPIAFKVTAVSGDFSDGELRPIPVLPGRMHLVQSRFVTLKDRSRREMKFEDLARSDDPSLINQQLVVTIDAQLFYSVLSALPYLVNYPYECTEQTLNRFISTGILASMYQNYPAIERMAKEFSKRQTRLETWEAADPNRKMALEETPWVREAKGGADQPEDLINVLDPKITRAQRDASLAKLKKAQTSSGGFPWFPGGPPSPYLTLYLLYGFSKGLEFGVEMPRDMIQQAWAYLHRHYLSELVRFIMADDCCWEFITFLNYTISNYPAPDGAPKGGDSSWTGGGFSDEERKKMLDFSFRHWKGHSPYLKGFLALTLKRMGREKDGRLVWESVMDSARTAEDQGTFWAPEERGWLWYNDTIETHAFAVRTVMELTPREKKLDGLVLWLFLNKKLNHWKSTRATAEVIYSLAHYLKQTEQLGVREEIRVTVGDQQNRLVFEPEQYHGKKNQVVIAGEKIDPKTSSTVVVEKETKGFAFASATWHFSTEKLPEQAQGDYLNLTRSYFRRLKGGKEVVLKPLKEGERVEVGDEVEVHLSLRSKHPMEYVHLRDPRAAGFEPISLVSGHKWNLGLCWYEEVRDSGMNFFFEHLPQGEYPFSYRVRASIAGTFKAAPATVQPMYAPEFAAYSAGDILTIQPAK